MMIVGFSYTVSAAASNWRSYHFYFSMGILGVGCILTYIGWARFWENAIDSTLGEYSKDTDKWKRRAKTANRQTSKDMQDPKKRKQMGKDMKSFTKFLNKIRK